MSRSTTKPQLTKVEIKTQFKQSSQGTQNPKGRQPVKAQNPSPSQSMGNILNPPNRTLPTVYRSETTDSSQSRQSRTLTRDPSASKRSNSQQPNVWQHSSSNTSNNKVPDRTSYVSEYVNDKKVVVTQRSDYAKYGVSRAALDSSTSYYGQGAGVDATASFFAPYLSENWSSRTSPESLNVLVHTFETSGTSCRPSDADLRSNGRQSRAAERKDVPRLRSASQGLRNLGNTCYMNSILQCLAKVPWFKDGHLRQTKFQDDLLNEFFGLMKKMQENNDYGTSLDPYLFRKQISALGFRFSSSQQNDAHEFLLCLLSCLSKTLKSEGKDDIIKEFLSGEQQNVIRFNNCKHVLVNDQPFFSLSLPLTSERGKFGPRKTEVELRYCLDNYTKKEDVDGDALCLDCQQMQNCTIEASFKQLPKFLIIHLKRYDFEKGEKLESEVSFPLEKLIIKQKKPGEVSGSKDIFYDLIAVSNHYGTLHFGHYTADIKSSSNNWYHYSDSRVTQTRMKPVSRDAYILFYQQS